jgi:hypothetical protein
MRVKSDFFQGIALCLGLLGALMFLSPGLLIWMGILDMNDEKFGVFLSIGGLTITVIGTTSYLIIAFYSERKKARERRFIER